MVNPYFIKVNPQFRKSTPEIENLQLFKDLLYKCQLGIITISNKISNVVLLMELVLFLEKSSIKKNYS